RAKIYLEELYSITAKATISELGATLGLRQPNDYVSYGVDCLAALEKQIAETETDWPSWDKADHFERIAQAVHLANQQDAWYGERVGGVARFLALECGFDRHYAREIGRAAKLHDIGLTLVRHPGLKQCLSEESGTMAHHTDEGARLLGQSSQHPRALLAATIAHYHHERWDGDGCHGVAGQVIPEPARIVAVAIAVVELYKKHGSADIVCTALAADVGAFDPKIVKTCCRSVQSGYLRRLLPRLGQGRHAFDHIIKGFTQNG
ncbi:MAG: HD domain-containing protein, partial [Betaproteobacteria bacterium]|nr:HD domain-containing protein [Betaproteobacteria bacterium]